MTKVIHWKSDMTHSDVHGRIDKKKKHLGGTERRV